MSLLQRWHSLPLIPLWQVYQLARAGGALLSSILLAHRLQGHSSLPLLEAGLALSLLCTAPVLTALGQAYLRAVGAAKAVSEQQLSALHQRVGRGVLAASAAVVALAWALLQSNGPDAASSWYVLGVAALLLAAPLLAPLLELQLLVQQRRSWLIILAMAQGLLLPLLAWLTTAQPEAALWQYPLAVLAVGVALRVGWGAQLWRERHLAPPASTPAIAIDETHFPWSSFALLLLVALAGLGADALDALLVRHSLAPDAFLSFRYGARELPLTLVLATAASAALSQLVAGAHTAAERSRALAEVKRQHRRLIVIGFGTAAVLLLASDALFAAVYPLRYAPAAARVFDLYLLLAISRVLLPQAVLLGLGHTRPLLVAAVAELVLHVGLTLLLLPHLGLYAPAIAACTAYLLEKLVLLAALRRYELPLSQVVDLPRWALASTALILLYTAKHIWLLA